jgi:hypothetical protein
MSVRRKLRCRVGGCAFRLLQLPPQAAALFDSSLHLDIQGGTPSLFYLQLLQQLASFGLPELRHFAV